MGKYILTICERENIKSSKEIKDNIFLMKKYPSQQQQQPSKTHDADI